MGAAEHQLVIAQDLAAVLASPTYAGMRAVDQWIVWRLDPPRAAGEKNQKVPVGRAGHGASAFDATNWSSADQAVSDAQRLGPRYGVGFAFTRGCGFWFNDLDSALLPDGWSPLAKQTCAVFAGAAVELSSSLQGLHLFGRGAVPDHRCRNDEHHAELYTHDRFAAVTGLHAQGDCNTDHTAAMQWFASTYFPPRAAAAGDVPDDGPCPDWSGPEDDSDLVLLLRTLKRPVRNPFDTSRAPVSFNDLFDANARVLCRSFPSSKGDAFDRSRATYVLASELAYGTGKDVARIEQIMRTSPLYYEKWDRADGWLFETIREACAAKKSVLRQRTAPLTPEQVIDRLRDLKTPEAIRSTWVGLAVPLSAVERECVIHWVDMNIGAPGPQALKRELRAADHAARQRQRQEAFAEDVGDKAALPYRKEAATEAATAIEALIVAAAQPGEFVSFGGVLAHVTTKPLPNTHLIDDADAAPPAVPQIEPLDSVAVLQRIERVVVLHETANDGSPRPIAVPDRVIEILLKKKQHGAPAVNGLVTHPLVLRDGSILATDGLHAESGLYLFGAALPDVRPYAQHEAALAVVRLRELFLAGFEFATQLDADVALAGLFTGVQRRLLDSAPGLAALASAQSSGKTTLLRRTHLMLSGRDMPVSTFPINNETEVAKGLLSALLRSPCMIVFDNVPDGFTFSSGSLAAAMTTSVYEQRVLGVSRDASVPTTVLFGLTGNNITLGNDEVTRWMVCRLAPATARPQERAFRHPDVVAHALAIRPQVLRDVVGIVAGYIACAHVGKAATRYPTWDRLVRQPLVWAGASDVAEVFAANAEQSEPVRAHRALLHALRSLYGHKEFRASDVATAAVASHAGANATLRFALESLAVRAIDQARSVGHALRAAVGRAAEVDGHTLRLAKNFHSHDKIDLFRVEVAVAGNCGVL